MYRIYTILIVKSSEAFLHFTLRDKTVYRMISDDDRFYDREVLLYMYISWLTLVQLEFPLCHLRHLRDDHIGFNSIDNFYILH